jgi:hypothetical protein
MLTSKTLTMKKISFLRNSIITALIPILIASCQKNQEQPQQSQTQNGNSTIQQKTIIDTINIEDSLWVTDIQYYGAGGASWGVTGDYYSDLAQLVGRKQIIDVLVNIEGDVKLVGSSYTLAYRGGFFKRDGSILYFSCPYGQMSLRSVPIEIVTKD